MKYRACFAFLFCLLASPLFSAESPTPTPTPPALLLVRAAHWIDPVAGVVKDNQVVLIEGDKVKQVGAAADLTKGLAPDVRVIDLGDATVVPGLIDCHTHVTGQSENYYEDIFRKSPIDVATTSHIYARRTLLAGFT